MLDKKVEQLLNEQINKEFYSAYLYLDFANFYQSKGLDGFATGTRFRHRRNGTMRCCFISICITITAPLCWKQLRSRTRYSRRWQSR